MREESISSLKDGQKQSGFDNVEMNGLLVGVCLSISDLKEKWKG